MIIWERLLILLAAAAVGYCALLLWRHYLQRKVCTVAEQGLPPELQTMLQVGPNLLYFTGQHCSQCHLQQTPILGQLAADSTVPIHTIDAMQAEGLAKFYGIMTVPTTIVLDGRWRPHAINHGLATLSQLRQQVTQVHGAVYT